MKKLSSSPLWSYCHLGKCTTWSETINQSQKESFSAVNRLCVCAAHTLTLALCYANSSQHIQSGNTQDINSRHEFLRIHIFELHSTGSQDLVWVPFALISASRYWCGDDQPVALLSCYRSPGLFNSGLRLVLIIGSRVIFLLFFMESVPRHSSSWHCNLDFQIKYKLDLQLKSKCWTTELQFFIYNFLFS